jgi:pimeloyl-ACP methyl ester carboxylesterase
MKQIPLFFETFGEGIHLILLHGFPLNRTIWYPLLPFFEGKVKVILPDLRGHGKSRPTPGVATMKLMAEDVISLMDEYQIQNAVIGGHSMGGYVALELVRQFPKRIIGLALVSSHAESDPPDRVQQRYNMADRVERDGVAFLAKDMASRLTTQARLVPSIEQIILQNPALGAANASRGMAVRDDLSAFLETWNNPALVIGGDTDPFNPVERTKRTSQLLTNSRLVLIPGGGHMPMMEEPQIVSQALLDLCQRAAEI